jgi:signal transduction histidine kinase
MRRTSLSKRLALAATVLIAVSLFVADLVLVFMFRWHMEQRFDRALADQMEELIAASEVDASGKLRLTWTPVDPRFNRPGSGWYWEISQDGLLAEHSLSLVGMSLDVTSADHNGIFLLNGPAGAKLRAATRPITLPGADKAFRFIVAGPVDDITADVRRFSTITGITLAVLGVGLVGAVVFQVKFGLQPLVDLRESLSAIRAGKAQRMPESFPAEVEPVVEELNAVLDHNAALLTRARTQAGDLAHALKHPLMVIAQQAREIEGEAGRLLTEQVTAMNASVNRHLSRARIAGPGGAIGAHTPIARIFEDLRYSLDLLYRDRGLVIDGEGLDDLNFAGDAQDMEEMLGNLMDNACKWARGRLRVSAGLEGGRLRIAVEDDGPGIAPAHREAVLARGRRLDESVAGSGLGLGIVRDIAEIYRGGLSIESSDLGGVMAVLDLPAAT